jgi:hypothetical protein
MVFPACWKGRNLQFHPFFFISPYLVRRGLYSFFHRCSTAAGGSCNLPESHVAKPGQTVGKTGRQFRSSGLMKTGSLKKLRNMGIFIIL